MKRLIIGTTKSFNICPKNFSVLKFQPKIYSLKICFGVICTEGRLSMFCRFTRFTSVSFFIYLVMSKGYP